MQYVKVKPANEDMRKLLKHPTGVRFDNGDAGTLWPVDQFTTRRLNDGDIIEVKDEKPAAKSAAKKE